MENCTNQHIAYSQPPDLHSHAKSLLLPQLAGVHAADPSLPVCSEQMSCKHCDDHQEEYKEVKDLFLLVNENHRAIRIEVRDIGGRKILQFDLILHLIFHAPKHALRSALQRECYPAVPAADILRWEVQNFSFPTRKRNLLPGYTSSLPRQAQCSMKTPLDSCRGGLLMDRKSPTCHRRVKGEGSGESRTWTTAVLPCPILLELMSCTATVNFCEQGNELQWQRLRADHHFVVVLLHHKPSMDAGRELSKQDNLDAVSACDCSAKKLNTWHRSNLPKSIHLLEIASETSDEPESFHLSFKERSE
eukprot:765957-Hanusia_phi.AAC.11